MSNKPREYIQGDVIASIGELIPRLDNREWLYWGSKPKHPSIFENMSLCTLRVGIKRGIIRVAIRRDNNEGLGAD